jgi:hypothetical protein
MLMTINDREQLVLFAGYSLLAIYVSICILNVVIPVSDVILWIATNPIAKCAVLFAIFIAAKRDPFVSLILIVMYVIVDYDAYISRKYFNNVVGQPDIES